MFYESLIILNISTLNFSEGVPASVLGRMNDKQQHTLLNLQVETPFLFEKKCVIYDVRKTLDSRCLNATLEI